MLVYQRVKTSAECVGCPHMCHGQMETPFCPWGMVTILEEGFPARMDDPKPYRFATKDWDPGQCLSISVGVFYCDTLPECSPEDFVSATFPDNTTQGMETVCPRIFVTSALCQILLIHHVMACGWYYLGTMSEDGHGDLKKLSGLII